MSKGTDRQLATQLGRGRRGRSTDPPLLPDQTSPTTTASDPMTGQSLISVALSAGNSPDAYNDACRVMQTMDPHGIWHPIVCQLNDTDLPTVEEILTTVNRWLADLNAVA